MSLTATDVFCGADGELTVGSLCTGYGGLDHAVERVTGGRTAWFCEKEAGPSALLRHHHREIPNYGDLLGLDWVQQVVDIVTAGWPCQPFSGAGKQLGSADDRHLFPSIVAGLARMRPTLFLGENVRNHLNIAFDQVLTALDRIDYDVRWTILPASDVGAPHGRPRLWVAARDRQRGGWPAPSSPPLAHIRDGVWFENGDGLLFAPDPLPLNDKGSVPVWPSGTLVDGVLWQTDVAAPQHRHSLLFPTPEAKLSDSGPDYARATRPGSGGDDLTTTVHRAFAPTAGLLPTPTSRDHKGANQRGDDSCLHGALLPTPRATDGTKGGPNQRGSSGDLMLPSAVQLLPTPAAGDAKNTRNSTARRTDPNSQHHAGDTLCDIVHDGRMLWGPYTAAVHRWEQLTRPAPSPTQQGRNGPRLNPAFVEWMQGLPTGWVTDVPGLTRNQQLAMLGNGVVPQCAAVAYTLLGISPEACEVAA